MLSLSHWGLIHCPASWDWLGWMWDENPMEFGLDKRLHGNTRSVSGYL